MVQVEEAPLLWTLQFAVGLFTLLLLLLLAGCSTLYLTQSSLPHHVKLQLTVATYLVIALLSLFIFDPKTHIIGRMLCAYGTVFTSPLNSIAILDAFHRAQSKLLPPPYQPFEVLLRIAIPTAHPSKHHPCEPPAVQLARGIVFLNIASVLRHGVLFISHPSAPTLVRSLCTLLFLNILVSAILNLVSCLLGFLGYQSPSPFRNAFLSHSMASFWAGEWNAPVSDAMRAGIYQPLIRRGINRSVAAMMCFVFSAYAHEILLLFCGYHSVPSLWSVCFVSFGAACVLEKMVIEYIPKRLRRLCSFLALYALYHFFFVPPPYDSGVAAAAAKEIGNNSIVGRRLWSLLIGTA